MNHSALVLRSSSVVLFALAASGEVRRFPFEVVPTAPGSGVLELSERTGEFDALASQSRVTFAAVALPGGALVDVELRRVELAALDFGYRVDGEPAPQLAGEVELSVWMGHVVGDPGSDAAFAFSPHGSRGWIQSQGQLSHLVSEPDAALGWAKVRTRWIDELELNRRGSALGEFCQIDRLVEQQAQEVRPPPAQKSHTNSLYEAKIAIETDFQLFQVFGNNLVAETTYVTTLMSWVSYRYQEQLDVILTYPYVQFYTTSNDPWVTQEQGGGAGGLLYEFQNAWAGNVPGGADIGHFLSGAGLGGGVAWLPGLCNSPYNFSVCGNINGGVSFPPQVGPGNWDFMVSAHELGHNFGAPHTHDYCPPVDQCAPSGYFGQCQTSQVCTSQGTIMSYCHLCSGGMNNITTYLHSASATDMRNWVENSGCLSLYIPDPVVYCVAKFDSLSCLPTLSHSGHPTLSGPDDFVLGALGLRNNKFGMYFWGMTPAQIPFPGGGYLCVQPPVVRTPVQDSTGSLPPTQDCSGELSWFWTHTALSAIGPGNTLFGQFWYRDNASGVGLTEGMQVTIYN